MGATVKKIPAKPVTTTVRIESEANKKFRIACTVLKLNAHNQLATLLNEWAEPHLKELDKKTLDALIGRKKLGKKA